MYPYLAPSPQNLLIFEFVDKKTVQRVNWQGCKAIQAERAKSDTLYFNVRAKVSINKPHPDEQAWFSPMRVIDSLFDENSLHVLSADVRE